MFDPLRLPEPSSAIGYSRVTVNAGHIKTHRALTHDTDEIVIAFDPARPIHARGGQFATLRFPGMEQPRPYSFARDPQACPPGELSFFIRRVPDGEVSTWLGAANRSGEPVEIAGPLGGFGLDDATAPMLCIAGGSGMSAILALIEAACAAPSRRDCCFYYGARTREDLYCINEIEAVRDAWPQAQHFEFVPVLSEEPADSSWAGARGFVTDIVKAALIDSGRLAARDASVFFCGPPPMIDAGRRMLETAGTPPEQIYCDAFEDARSPAPVIDNRLCVLCDECLLVKPIDDCIVETAGIAGSDGTGPAFEPLRPAHSSGLYYNSLYIDPERCIRCYACVQACPHDAISPRHEVAKTLRQGTIS